MGKETVIISFWLKISAGRNERSILSGNGKRTVISSFGSRFRLGGKGKYYLEIRKELLLSVAWDLDLDRNEVASSITLQPWMTKVIVHKWALSQDERIDVDENLKVTVIWLRKLLDEWQWNDVDRTLEIYEKWLRRWFDKDEITMLAAICPSTSLKYNKGC